MSSGMRRVGAVLLRILAATIGGYAFASLAALLVARLLPWCCGWSRAEGMLTGTLLSFLFYVAAVLWVFNARSVAIVASVAIAAFGLSAILFPGWPW